MLNEEVGTWCTAIVLAESESTWREHPGITQFSNGKANQLRYFIPYIKDETRQVLCEKTLNEGFSLGLRSSREHHLSVMSLEQTT